jgi:hypothetical protein
VDRVGPKQIEWLKERLRVPASRRFVFVHKPLWSRADGISAAMRQHWAEQVHALLKERNCEAVFAAHHTNLEFQEIDGIRYLCTSGAGKEFDPKKSPRERGGFHHFIKVSVPKDGPCEIKVVEKDAEHPQDLVKPIPPRKP